MGIPDSHWGEDDPDYYDGDDDPEFQEELFRTSRSMGMKPEDMSDKAFAAKYEEWLKTAKDCDL